MAYNLFANVDDFASTDNYSFSKLDNSNAELEPINVSDIDKKRETRTTKSRKRKNQSTKSNKKSEVSDVSDIDDTDTATVVNPGVGRKTAFKKLTQLKKNLATIAETSKPQTRASANVTLREDHQRSRPKRARVSANVQTPYVDEYSSSAALSRIVANELEEEELSLSIKVKWEGTSKIEKIPFSLVG